ncbi:MAG: GNAT family N-acetyltransferase [Methanosphaera sp. rholeuAM6]|nr:MAG: GNAT family N-acetyltransferase [Methanosphaera sp. rholeuAM6]
MNIEIMELKKDLINQYHVENFLFRMVKESYGLDYVPEYHYDIKNLQKYYLKPQKNNFYIAIDKDTDKIIATSGIRGYDREEIIKDRKYSIDDTASIYRVFVEKEYRHHRIASRLIQKIEDFCKRNYYSQIYLHTQKDSYGALPFWLSQDFKIIDDTHDEMGTIHMEKVINRDLMNISSVNENKKQIGTLILNSF